MADEKKKKFADIFDELENEESPKEEPKKEEPSITIISGEAGKEPKETKITKKMVFEDEAPEEPPKENPVKILIPETPKPFFTSKAKGEEFDLSPARALVKHVVMIYGDKGEGKSTLGQSFPHSHVDISFDQKTEAVRQNSKYKDKILVFDGSRYLDKSSSDEWLESSERTWRYLNKLLDSIPNIDTGKEGHAPELVIKEDGTYREYVSGNPDWIMVDAGEVFETVAEMVMRYRNNLKAFEGFANKNLWKERRMYLDQLLRKCLHKAKKGVIWTSYIKQQELIENGEFIAKKDAPRWIDCILLETDVVIRVDRTTGKSGQCFFATVESSKWSSIPESGRTDITKKGIETLTKGEI